MKIRLTYTFLLISFVALGAWSVLFSTACAGKIPGFGNGSAAFEKREEAYRANNLGVALLEQFKHNEAAVEFRRALSLEPKLKMAQINLAIALFNSNGNIEETLEEARKALAAAPDSPQPHYILGLIARQQNRNEEALASFNEVLKFDPDDVGTSINIGQVYLSLQKTSEAIPVLQRALESEPYNSTAMYNLGTALMRSGDEAQGKEILVKFQALRESGASTSIGEKYFEQGRYAEAITSTGAESELVDKKTPEAAFADAAGEVFGITDGGRSVESKPVWGREYESNSLTAKEKDEIIDSVRGASLLFDFDADGDLDYYYALGDSQHLFRNENGKFTEVTAKSGALAKASSDAVTGAVAGDFNNDELTDLFVLRRGTSSLYRNQGNGNFTDVTASAKIPNYPHLSISAALIDVEHDGDLDIFIAGFADLDRSSGTGSLKFPESFAGAPHVLLRNNGDETFTDITAEAKISGTEQNQTVAVIPFDFDNGRDIDLLTVNYSGEPGLFRNLRNRSFQDVATNIGLDATASGSVAAAGDVNKDGFTDLFFGSGKLALSDGKGKYSLSDGPAPGGHYSGAQFFDYDADGLHDLVTMNSDGVSVYRNLGDSWVDVTGRAVDKSLRSDPAKTGVPLRGFSVGDVDSDGDSDLLAVTSSGGLKFGRNDLNGKNRSIRVRLTGKVSNRSGIGAKIEVRAGSLIQKIESNASTPATAPADNVFGLGPRTSTDAVRVLWPAGIVQSETASSKEAPPGKDFEITELDRKPSSCPFLYTWNGREFEFVTDFMGGGEMGYWIAPGVRAKPDPDEYVRIRGDQLVERNGRYEIRVTNELEETLFMDHLKLLAVSHPVGTGVFPNEGLGNPTSGSFKLYKTRSPKPPAAAVDDKGNDVLDTIVGMDRSYPDGFKLDRLRGYAEEHSLTLDLGESDSGRYLLLMTGWTDYAFSSDNVAASQRNMSLRPPRLEVKNSAGNWITAIENIGIPVGRPQTMTVDLKGKFPTSGREVRIVTNMRVYWDQILVDTADDDSQFEISELEPVVADLKWRGFSAFVTPDGREPFGYDYERVSLTSPWKTMRGSFTREGDVRELLKSVDDIFVISKPGDAISIAFDAASLKPLKEGWIRTYLVYVDGFSKEMDINSSNPDQVFPLPFHGMSNYPYPDNEEYPMTPERRNYFERYNTRKTAAQILPIEAEMSRKK